MAVNLPSIHKALGSTPVEQQAGVGSMSISPALQRGRQGNLECRASLACRVNLRPDRAT